MTPHQLASQHCASFDLGRCVGLGSTDDGHTIRLWPIQPCFAHQCRCSYWETCVAPQVRSLASGVERDSYLQAIRLYLDRIEDSTARATAKRNIFGPQPDEATEMLTPSRLCPICGKPMAARHRFCDQCAKSRRRQASHTRIRGGN